MSNQRRQRDPARHIAARRQVTVLRPWPWQPLADRISPAGAHRTIAAALHISGQACAALAACGWLSTDEADRYAVRVGCHPAEIWPDWAFLPDDVAAFFRRIRQEIAAGDGAA